MYCGVESYTSNEDWFEWTNAAKHHWGGAGGESESRQVIGESQASNRVYSRDIRIRIFGRAILRRFVRAVALSVSASNSRVGIVVRIAS